MAEPSITILITLTYFSIFIFILFCFILEKKILAQTKMILIWIWVIWVSKKKHINSRKIHCRFDWFRYLYWLLTINLLYQKSVNGPKWILSTIHTSTMILVLVLKFSWKVWFRISNINLGDFLFVKIIIINFKLKTSFLSINIFWNQ